MTKERVPIHVFDLLIRNFKHETLIRLTHKSSNENLCQHLMHNDYTALIAFFCDINVLKKNPAMDGIRTNHRAIQRYSSYVSRLSKKCPSSFDE